MSTFELFKLILTNKKIRSLYLQEYKLYIQNTKVFNFFSLWALFLNISFSFLTKKYVRESSVVGDLEDAYMAIVWRTKPLPQVMVNRFEELAFSKVPWKSKVGNPTTEDCQNEKPYFNEDIRAMIDNVIKSTGDVK